MLYLQHLFPVFDGLPYSLAGASDRISPCAGVDWAPGPPGDTGMRPPDAI